MTNLLIELRDNEKEYKWKVVSQYDDTELEYFYSEKRAWRALNRIAREYLIFDITVVPIHYVWAYNKEYGYYEWREPKNE